MGIQASGLKDISFAEASPWIHSRTADRARDNRPFSSDVKLSSMLVDSFVVLTSWSLALTARFQLQLNGPQTEWIAWHDALFFFVYLGILVLSCHANELYNELRRRSASAEVLPIIRAQILATVLLTSIVYISNNTIMSLWMIAATSVINIGMFITWRVLWRLFLVRRFERGCGTRNVLVLGAGEVGRAMARYLIPSRDGYHFVGFLDSRADWPDIIGDPRDFAKLARLHFIDTLFITAHPDRELAKTIIEEARNLNISIKVVSDYFDGLPWDARVEYVGDFPAQVVYRPPIQRSALAAKRAMDVAVATVALLILLPVFLSVAVIIRLDSKGPILYRAERVGKKGRRFVCYKFRTMVANADALKHQFRHLNERSGLLFKIREDPRTTRVGRFLRKYSLDELPQLWNVLKGDMSLVGPRPPLNSEVELYSPEHLRRLNVTPGMTGLWQVTARQDPSFETYFAMDLHYIETWSPLLDVKLLFKTIPAVLKGTGS